jgi:glucan 1,3-beta-glucosidase
VPAGTKMVGEAWSEIMGSGSKFYDISNPHVMVSVGSSGSSGIMEISDMLFTGEWFMVPTKLTSLTSNLQ